MRKAVLLVIPLFLGVIIGCEDGKESTPDPKSGVLASFSAKNNNCTAPCKVQLINNSKEAKKYKWLLGNGDTATKANPTAVYTKGGEYNVSLIAKNDGKRDVRTKQIKIESKLKSFIIREVTLFDYPSENPNDEADVLVFTDFDELNSRLTGFFDITKSELPVSNDADEDRVVNFPFSNFFSIFIRNEKGQFEEDLEKEVTFNAKNIRELPNPYPNTIAFKDEDGKTYVELRVLWQ